MIRDHASGGGTMYNGANGYMAAVFVSQHSEILSLALFGNFFRGNVEAAS